MNASNLTYFKVRCTKTNDIISVYNSAHIEDGYEGYLINNPYRCRFEETSKAEYETLKVFLENRDCL